jgi:hypothetical protein
VTANLTSFFLLANNAGPAKQFSYVGASVLKTWDDAQAFCQSKGDRWSLASIESNAEKAIVWSLVQNLGTNGLNIWIGFAVPPELRTISAQHSNKFVWADGSQSSYRDWASSEPNNYNNVGEQYVFIPVNALRALAATYPRLPRMRQSIVQNLIIGRTERGTTIYALCCDHSSAAFKLSNQVEWIRPFFYFCMCWPHSRLSSRHGKLVPTLEL